MSRATFFFDPFHPNETSMHYTILSKRSQNENLRPLLYWNRPPITIEKCFQIFDLIAAMRRKVHITPFSQQSQNENVRHVIVLIFPNEVQMKM